MTTLKKIIEKMTPYSSYQGELQVSQDVSLPFTLLKGASLHPFVTLTAAVHGSEYVGVRVLMDLVEEIDLLSLQGTLCLVHAVNPSGFWARSPYLVPEDQIDLNRIFQDDQTSDTLSYRIKKVLQEEVFSLTDALLDLHGGNALENLVPHVYYSTLALEEVVEKSKNMALASGIPILYASRARGGLYQSAAIDYGIPSIILEQGELGLCPKSDVIAMKTAVYGVLHYLWMGELPQVKAQLFEESYTLYSSYQGCWFSFIKAGDVVGCGQKLGEIRSIYGELLEEVVAPSAGLVLYQKVVVAVEAKEQLMFVVHTGKEAICEEEL
ncbi:DUF2817 domain-containing protein [Streptococcus himalayensis]|uniref:Peptidase M14 n=1 Tax=Streptococcus himalayensis TaxID=1888195 RepID=A0A917EF29_9STRE|nr:DUF2817 domain-containing protein [Streptococcus himalayensis]GGE34734.1 peptidase M14 [Streptococcus himalayensis]